MCWAKLTGKQGLICRTMDQPLLSAELRAEIRMLMDQYPPGRGRSAILPALYAIQRVHGHVSVERQNELAAILNLEPAEVGAVVSFYHMIHQEPKGDYLLQVCTNVPCMLRGAGQCMQTLEDKLGLEHGETTEDGVFTLAHMECLGSCATAPMTAVTERSTGRIRYFEELDSEVDIELVLTMLRDGQGFTTLERWTPQQDPDRKGAGAGPYTVAGMEEPFLTRRVGRPASHQIEDYMADGGYDTARTILTRHEPTPAALVEQVKASGLKGRGGAGFPTGVKWGFLAPNAFPRYLVVNADESEPGTFKDRCVMEYDPHQLIEAIILTAYAVQAEEAYIYIRGEYYFAFTRLQAAISEAEAQGFLGSGICDTDMNLRIVVHRGAGAYICGEESALLSSLEGYRGFPRSRPPFPAVAGLYAKPTIINNVESVCNVLHIARMGPDAYRAYGTEASPGFRMFCLSGNVRRPGLYELPHGTTLQELIFEHGGGMQHEDIPLRAVIPGGLSMQLFSADQMDTGLDPESISAAGSNLGSAGIIVMDENASMIEVGLRTVSFFREESCGKCTPCREGTVWMEDILKRIQRGGGREADLQLLQFIADNIAGKSFCPFGFAAVWGLQSNLAKFGPDWTRHIHETNPGGQGPDLPVRPIYRPDTESQTGLHEIALAPMGESPLTRDAIISLESR